MRPEAARRSLAAAFSTSAERGGRGGSRPAPGLMRGLDQRVLRAARLLVGLGAEVRRDVLYDHVVLPPGVSWLEEWGLRFTRRLFDVRLGVGADGCLCYRMGPSTVPVEVAVLLRGDSGSHGSGYRPDEMAAPPREWWDRFYRMVEGVRPHVFGGRRGCLDLALRLEGEADREHRARPRRETYLLRRQLGDFVDAELQRLRRARRERNLARRAAYEELVRLARSAPHSLNVVKGMVGGVSVRELSRGYWKVSVPWRGDELCGWGCSPVHAAASLLDVHGRELRGRAAA